MASLPRGIRNHNPGNIDRGRDRWRPGMRPQAMRRKEDEV